ncbi:copper resistance protein B [Microbulbifer epialgicus]|uniref:Copper resistance protein B n=1 Tax=Microbulbifer epialgicus TaxID=393907 RepID=A0ABV4P0V0_9GAMM
MSGLLTGLNSSGQWYGFFEAELGLRLLSKIHPKIHPKFLPYIGVHYEQEVGNTADFAREEGEDVYSTLWIIGFRAWY